MVRWELQPDTRRWLTRGALFRMDANYLCEIPQLILLRQDLNFPRSQLGILSHFYEMTVHA